MNGSAEASREFDPRALRDALGTFLTGVTVLTTIDRDGSWRGMTANSFTSVSLDPPCVLVCVDRRAASYDVFTNASSYAVNILGKEQQDAASTFASKRPDKFSTVEAFAAATGSPVLRNSIAWLDCEIAEVHEIGDHAVLIGRVVDFGRSGGQPLGYHQGHFVSFAPEAVPAGLAGAGGLCVSWIVEDRVGRVAFRTAPDGTVSLPSRIMDGGDLDEGSLGRAGSASVGSPLSVDFLYSLYANEASRSLAITYRAHLDSDSEDHAVDISFVPLDEHLWERFANETELSVVRRFRDERETQRFGVYSGTSTSGRVATIHDLRHDNPRPVESTPAKVSNGGR